MTDVPGLREQKRVATRNALQIAMLQQAVDRGFDNVTVEDVATAAQVSPRTFFNYFASKEDAVTGEHMPFELAAEDVARFQAGTGDVLADLVELFAGMGDDEGIEIARLRKRLIQAEPRLLGIRMSRMQRAHEAATDFVAERLRSDRVRQGAAVDEASVRDDAGLVVMVGIAITRHGWSRWVDRGGSLADRVREGYVEFRGLVGGGAR